ncbi:hypothetical protein [Nocardioides mesophilus]|uniref:hypothetical protein n=1 Tax=Nocardioides mesophilus TaxID=433659 RepID=UPI001CB7168F|nr:hypothetical protein [Nocardioides mesophilus]
MSVADPDMVERAVHAHERANELCFIANSVNFPVRHAPEVTVAPTRQPAQPPAPSTSPST